MRLFADTNVMAATVRALRALGHDVVYAAERSDDPGDAALLSEAQTDRPCFITKDHDIGALVFRDHAVHAGVLLIDDLADPVAEARLVVNLIQAHEQEIVASAFVRAGRDGVRISF